jgi:hypothetical protein
MTALSEACAGLAAARRAFEDIPPWLPGWLYRRRMNRAVAAYRTAIVAMFDAQVAAIHAGEPYR